VRLLVVETSAAEGSVALAGPGDALSERIIPTPRAQTELILPLVAELLAESGQRLQDLDALAFGRGPGSFTGLRVAAAVTQGLALASGRPIVAVSSMAALAQRAWLERGAEAALVCVDARMGEIYWGFYRVRDGLATLAGEESLGPPERVPVPGPQRDWVAVGSGFAVAPEALAEQRGAALAVNADLAPRARDLLPLARAEVAAGRFLVPEDAVPVYLRGGDAWRRLKTGRSPSLP